MRPPTECTLCGCNIDKSGFKCSGCHAAVYCSSVCAIIHWKSGDHRKTCKVARTNLYSPEEGPDTIGDDVDMKKQDTNLWLRPKIVLDAGKFTTSVRKKLEKFLERTMIGHIYNGKAGSEFESLHMLTQKDIKAVYGDNKDYLGLGDTRLFPNQWFTKPQLDRYLFLMVDIPSGSTIGGIMWRGVKPNLAGAGTVLTQLSEYPEVFGLLRKEGTARGRIDCPPIWTHEGSRQYMARLELARDGKELDDWTKEDETIELTSQRQYRASFVSMEAFPETAPLDLEMREEVAGDETCSFNVPAGDEGKIPRTTTPSKDNSGKADRMRAQAQAGQKRAPPSPVGYLRTYTQEFLPSKDIPDEDAEDKFGAHVDVREAVVLLEIEYFEVSCAYRRTGYGKKLLDYWRAVMLDDIFPNAYAFLYALASEQTINFYEDRLYDPTSFVSFEDFLSQPLERDYVVRGALLTRLHELIWNKARAKRYGNFGRNYVMSNRWRRQEGLLSASQYEFVSPGQKTSETTGEGQEDAKRKRTDATGQQSTAIPSAQVSPFNQEAVRYNADLDQGRLLQKLSDQMIDRIVSGSYFLRDVLTYAQGRGLPALLPILFSTVVRRLTTEVIGSVEDVYNLARIYLKVTLRYMATRSEFRLGSFFQLGEARGQVALNLQELLELPENATEETAIERLRDYTDALESVLLLAQIRRLGLYVFLDDAKDNGGQKIRHALALPLRSQEVSFSGERDRPRVLITNSYTPTDLTRRFLRELGEELIVLAGLEWPLPSGQTTEARSNALSIMFVRMPEDPSAFDMSTIAPPLQEVYYRAAAYDIASVGFVVPVLTFPILGLFIDQRTPGNITSSKLSAFVKSIYMRENPSLEDMDFKTVYEPILTRGGTLQIRYYTSGPGQ